MQKNKRKITHAVSLILILTFSFGSYVPKARATWPTIPVDAISNTMTTIQQTIATGWETTMGGIKVQEWANDELDRYVMPIAKQTAIILINKSVQSLIGNNNNGKPQFITNWNEYLYLNPQQRANGYMNSFFNRATGGRLSVLNEGISNSYDSYMVTQAQKANAGQPCAVDIQNYTSNPNQMFVDGNLRGFMAFLKPCNNPVAFATIAGNERAAQIEKEQNIAKLQQSNGFLPKMIGNVIMAPASLYENALTGIDQMGNNMLVNAKTYPELLAATAINIGSKTLQYNFGTANTQNRVSAQSGAGSSVNFRVNYNDKTGAGMSLNGTSVNTGVGAGAQSQLNTQLKNAGTQIKNNFSR